MKIRLSRKTVLKAILDYTIALITPVPVFLLSFLYNQFFSPLIMSLLFFPLIGLNAWHRNYKTGILTSIVSAFFFLLFFIPSFKIGVLEPGLIFQFVLFLLEGICLSFLVDAQKNKERILQYRLREKELKKKIRRLEEENAAYQKEIRFRDEFLSIASHELKTPLTSMLLQTQTALHNMRNVSLAQFSVERLMKMLESVEHQTKRLSKMINDLLSVSLITTGNLQLEREKVDLEKIVEDVINDFSTRIEREQYEIIYTVHESVIGYWDKVRIEQAIVNFLSNAIKYGNKKPIEIRVRKNNSFAEFGIKDNGIGISKDKHKRIFDLFERCVSPDEYKGLGVGLHITKEIVKAHGGTINVVSKPGKGTLFIMKLPLNLPKENT